MIKNNTQTLANKLIFETLKNLTNEEKKEIKKNKLDGFFLLDITFSGIEELFCRYFDKILDYPKENKHYDQDTFYYYVNELMNDCQLELEKLYESNKHTEYLKIVDNLEDNPEKYREFIDKLSDTVYETFLDFCKELEGYVKKQISIDIIVPD